MDITEFNEKEVIKFIHYRCPRSVPLDKEERESLAKAICAKLGTQAKKEESELIKTDKYFTYSGLRANGKFYIEFMNGWPKEMIEIYEKPPCGEIKQ